MFKNDVLYEERQSLAHKIRSTYPDRIPIIVESRNPRIKITKRKFLAPNDITLGNFRCRICDNILIDDKKLSPHETIFIFCDSDTSGSVLLPIAKTLSEIDDLYRSSDDLLYMMVEVENSFGQI